MHLLAASFMPRKNKETILKDLFKIWIAIYGSPQRILVDSGSEFANDQFREMHD